MSRDWQMGDPVDDANGGTMEPENWGRRYDEDVSTREIEDDSPDAVRDRCSNRAWTCFLYRNYEEALYYISLAINIDQEHAENWNKRGIILERMNRFEEAERAFNSALKRLPSPVVADNKAIMLKRWATNSIADSKWAPNRVLFLQDALAKINRAIDTLKEYGSNEGDIDSYISKKHEIEYSIKGEKEYIEKLNSLEGRERLDFIQRGREYEI